MGYRKYRHHLARLIETQCRYEVVRHSALTDLREVPIYPAPIQLCGFLLPPGGTAHYKTLLTDEKTGRSIERLDEGEIRTIVAGSYHLRVYGYVKYLDAFENLRESRFCEHYIWPLPDHKESGSRPLLVSAARSTLSATLRKELQGDTR